MHGDRSWILPAHKVSPLSLECAQKARLVIDRFWPKLGHNFGLCYPDETEISLFLTSLPMNGIVFWRQSMQNNSCLVTVIVINIFFISFQLLTPWQMHEEKSTFLRASLVNSRNQMRSWGKNPFPCEKELSVRRGLCVEDNENGRERKPITMFQDAELFDPPSPVSPVSTVQDWTSTRKG